MEPKNSVITRFQCTPEPMYPSSKQQNHGFENEISIHKNLERVDYNLLRYSVDKPQSLKKSVLVLFYYYSLITVSPTFVINFK